MAQRRSILLYYSSIFRECFSCPETYTVTHELKNNTEANKKKCYTQTISVTAQKPNCNQTVRDFTNKSVWPTWLALPHLTSHHSRVEAPEAQCQHFFLSSNAQTLSGARPSKKALGVGGIRWHLVRPSTVLLQSHPVVFSKPKDTNRTTEQSFNSVSRHHWDFDLADILVLSLTCTCLYRGSPAP